jgi:prepilin-type N-terminal cleavage/methylation domain-containing protein
MKLTYLKLKKPVAKIKALKLKKTLLCQTKSFTLVELLVVIAIIAVMSTIVLTAINPAAYLNRGEDNERTTVLRTIQEGLDIYYLRHGRYPGLGPGGSGGDHGGDGWWGYTYAKWNGGLCSGGISLKFENSASIGFLGVLTDEGIIKSPDLNTWNDPNDPVLVPGDPSLKYNCRYVVPQGEQLAGNVQRYLLHCNLEEMNDLEANDGGTNPTVFEIMEPSPWVCIIGNYD